MGVLFLFYDVWRQRICSEWVCNVLEVGFRLQFRDSPPMMGAPSAFVGKGSSVKHSALWPLIQSMQQNNVVEVVCDTTSPECYTHLFLEIPLFTMESAESIRLSLPRDAGVTSIVLVDTYFHIHPQRLLKMSSISDSGHHIPIPGTGVWHFSSTLGIHQDYDRVQNAGTCDGHQSLSVPG